MFETIYSVRKEVCESHIYTALFEELADARKFIEKEIAKIEGQCWKTKKRHLDGSFSETWDFDNVTFYLDDFAWVTDFRANGIKFYDHTGLTFDFDSRDALEEFFARSVRIALN